MKHQRDTIKKVKVTVTDKINCDRCGNDISLKTGSPDIGNIQGGFLEIGYGYGSRHDCSTWNAELCDDCCDALKDWIGDWIGSSGLRISNW